MDKLFHYYGSYLAARLAGMQQQTAQRLAYFCCGMTELQAGSDVVMRWCVAQDKGDQQASFSPCIVLCNNKQYPYGIHNCNLAFTQLPCLTLGSEKLVSYVESHHKQHQQLAIVNKSHHPLAMQQRFSYNPLTDINWHKKGEFKASFGEKILKKITKLGKQRSLIPGSPQQLDIDPRLQCIANSDLARSMLNHVIAQCIDTNNSIEPDPLARLGCCLFVYQQTWLYQLRSQQEQAHNQVTEKSSVSLYLTAFHWSIYAIQCYLTRQPMGKKLRIRLMSDGHRMDEINHILSRIFSFNGDEIGKEYYYLSNLDSVLAQDGLHHHAIQDDWYQGFRYRDKTLLERAFIASGGGSARQIKLLAAFRACDFYQLNYAAHKHSVWVDEQLKADQLAAFSTTQFCSTYT